MKVRIAILAALAMMGLVAGCSESPTAKYDAAMAAVEQARADGVEQYAPALFKEVADSLNAAAVEMQKQDGRFSLFRRYGKSEETIATAQQLSERAVQAAAAEKEKTRLADSLLITEIESLITATKDVIAAAPRGKGTRVDLKMMQSDVEAAAGALTVATQDFQAGNYLTARDKLQAVKAQVVRVKSEIDAATAKTTKM